MLAEIPADARSALDVGTGDGLLARDLRELLPEVVGVDADRTVLDAARSSVADVEWVHADVLAHDFGRRFDVVASIATLHHLPDAESALRRFAELTAPGGMLVIVGLARSSSLRDYAADAVGAIAHRVLSSRHGYWEHSAPMVWAPSLTYSEVRRAVDRALPGARWRRLPLFRYLIVWQAPPD